MSNHSNGMTLIPLFGLGFGGGGDATSAAMGGIGGGIGGGAGAMGYGGAQMSGMQAAGMGAAGGTFAGGAGGHRPQYPSAATATPPQGSAASPSVTITPAMKGLDTHSMGGTGTILGGTRGGRGA